MTAGQVATDGVIYGAGATLPWWAGLIEGGAHWWCVACVVVAVTIRALREVRAFRRGH